MGTTKTYRFRTYGITADPMGEAAYAAECVSGEETNCGQARRDQAAFDLVSVDIGVVRLDQGAGVVVRLHQAGHQVLDVLPQAGRRAFETDEQVEPLRDHVTVGVQCRIVTGFAFWGGVGVERKLTRTQKQELREERRRERLERRAGRRELRAPEREDG